MYKNKALIGEIAAYLNKGVTGFHTPGHKQGKGCSPEFLALMGKTCLQLDLTELPGLDNLRDPAGCIKEAQDQATSLFGAIQTFFLVNGSTAGIQAALLAVGAEGQEVLVPRNAHVAVLNGLVLSGGKPVLLPVEIDREWGIPLGCQMAEIEKQLTKHPAGTPLVITCPTYQGIVPDIESLVCFCRERGLPLIADEAHGAHLFFQEEKSLSAQKCKPDFVVHGAHKTLAALTQASLLHLNNRRWSRKLQRTLNILQTTSPSYLLMASLDGMQQQMRERGRLLVRNTIELAEHFRSSVAKLEGYRVFAPECGWHHDPTKVAVSAAELGLTGWELAQILQEKYAIAVEMSDYYYALFLISIGHDSQDINRAILALEGIRREYCRSPLTRLETPANLYEKSTPLLLTPREVFHQPQSAVMLSLAKGRIAGEPLAVYPPGVPLVWPGEVIEPEHIEYLQWAAGQGLKIEGLSIDGMVSVLSKG